MIDFNSIPAHRSLAAWVNLMERPSLDGNKWFVCRDSKFPDKYHKSPDFKAKMTVYEIIDTMADFSKIKNNEESLEIGRKFVYELKEKLEKKYYEGIIGLIRKIAAYIFSQYSFEKTVIGTKIDSLRTVLNEQLEPYRKERKLQVQMDLKKNYLEAVKPEIEESLQQDVLHQLESYFDEFFTRQLQDISSANRQKGLVSSSEYRNLANERNKLLEEFKKLNLNDEQKLSWYWDQIGNFYPYEENAQTLIDMQVLLPETFKNQHIEWMQDLLEEQLDKKNTQLAQLISNHLQKITK